MVPGTLHAFLRHPVHNDKPPDTKTRYFLPIMGSKNKPTDETFHLRLPSVAQERLCLSSLLKRQEYHKDALFKSI